MIMKVGQLRFQRRRRGRQLCEIIAAGLWLRDAVSHCSETPASRTKYMIALYRRQRGVGAYRRRGRNLQFPDRQLQRSDRRDRVGCSKLQFCPWISTKWGIFGPVLCIFGRKLSDRTKIFRLAEIYGGWGLVPPPAMQGRHWLKSCDPQPISIVYCLPPRQRSLYTSNCRW